MKVVQNRKEWRNNIVLKLMNSNIVLKLMNSNLDTPGEHPALDIITYAKEIEAYVFQDDFIVEVSDPQKKAALKTFIESINPN